MTAEAETNVAAMLREIKLLRAVAEAAIRLRAAGRIHDELVEVMDKLWAANPRMSRSGTPFLMAGQAFNTAMKNFDDAVLVAFESKMSWADLPELGPHKAGAL